MYLTNVHDIIRLTDLEHDIMNGPLFNRLHFVYQDSTSFFTWPSMRIQRFEHSLGCMHLAGQMFFNAIENAEKDVIFSFGRQMHEALCNLLDQLLRRLVKHSIRSESASASITGFTICSANRLSGSRMLDSSLNQDMANVSDVRPDKVSIAVFVLS